MRSYVCKSCGGEIVGDENTAATACPFCGNPVVMMGQFAGALRPDYVIPFKLDKEDQDRHLSTCGYGMTAITDDGIEYISNQFLPDLSDGDYMAAFAAYADLCDEFITQAKTGQPYDGDHIPKAPFNAVKCLLISMAIGLVIALIVTGSMKAKLKSVRMQSAAASYVKSNSMNITESRDMFLYHTVDRREKPKSGSSSGGSSSHTSSSGQTHGGGGGKF